MNVVVMITQSCNTVTCHRHAGIGSDHAKFQPGLCWYRMLPCLSLTRPVLGNEARQLQKCFSPGVVDVVKNSNGMHWKHDAGNRGAGQAALVKGPWLISELVTLSVHDIRMLNFQELMYDARQNSMPDRFIP